MAKSPTIEKHLSGPTMRERLIIKGFKHSDDMYKFLAEQADNRWKESKRGLKPGIYVAVAGQWRNVKRLPIGVLSHT
jgi:hypothetical protein